MTNYKIFTEFVETKAMEQFESAMENDFVIRGALMPDVHAGYSLPIGAVVATKEIILPSWVGYDIGCGMCAVPTTFKELDIRESALEIFKRIYEKVPVGFNHNEKNTEWEDEKNITRTDILDEIFKKNGLKQLGSLGGGNHFIEIGVGDDQRIWIITHSGSRGIGHSVATYYMKLASGDGKAREGHFGFSANEQNGQDYLFDMYFCEEFALENRKEIVRRVVNIIQEKCVGDILWGELINKNHNHAKHKNGMWIHRKGATHAEEGMMGVIPGNMRDGSFIVRGKGNPDSLWSSSHGAGRVLGRKEAKRTLILDEFVQEMKNIVSMATGETLDESPLAYKNINEVMDQQKDLVEIVTKVTPIINIKG